MRKRISRRAFVSASAAALATPALTRLARAADEPLLIRCTRGTAEWEYAGAVHYPGTYAHGGYNRETTMMGGLPVLNEDLVNLPNWLVLELRIDGEDAVTLEMSSCSTTVTNTTSGTRPSCGASAFVTAAAGRRR